MIKMADSEHIIDGKVVPYCGGRMNTDTNSWRDATEIELWQEQRIANLEDALFRLIRIAESCDNLDSDDQNEIDVAKSVFDEQC